MALIQVEGTGSVVLVGLLSNRYDPEFAAACSSKNVLAILADVDGVGRE
jgi:hypothetical protein